VDNNWAWSQTGSWGLPGQPLTYALQVRNYDVGCSASSFVVTAAVPNGFSVSMPTNTITSSPRRRPTCGAYVTSPATAADGNYPLTFTLTRAGTSSPSSSYTTYYKVYSSDSTAPTLFLNNPTRGQTMTGRSFDVAVSSSDDHAVKKIDLYIGNADATISSTPISSTACDDITYICHLNYKWSGGSGSYTAIFEATDWTGHVGVMTVHFSVS
jgi:Bacterial Ig domain